MYVAVNCDRTSPGVGIIKRWGQGRKLCKESCPEGSCIAGNCSVTGLNCKGARQQFEIFVLITVDGLKN